MEEGVSASESTSILADVETDKSFLFSCGSPHDISEPSFPAHIYSDDRLTIQSREYGHAAVVVLDFWVNAKQIRRLHSLI